MSSDVAAIADFCKKWRLTPSVTKTVSSIFHLDNKQARNQINIDMDGKRVAHDPYPVYLGVTLDRSLTFKHHATKTAAKIKTRNNLLAKLAGTTWGASVKILRPAALALCYSVAEYCAPAWGRSTHTKMVDCQLNESMRIISGTIRPTQLNWLPVLSNIAPPACRRLEVTAKLINQVERNPSLPIYSDIFNHPKSRLSSRHPIWSVSTDVTAAALWREKWEADPPSNSSLIVDPVEGVPGVDLPRREWCLLNRFRTGAGQCAASLHKWGYKDSPLCSCGEIQTMTHIIEDCRLFSFAGGLRALHSASESAVDWLRRVSCIR